MAWQTDSLNKSKVTIPWKNVAFTACEIESLRVTYFCRILFPMIFLPRYEYLPPPNVLRIFFCDWKFSSPKVLSIDRMPDPPNSCVG
mmetsp:Transcript_28805/g.70253  ORF Transcript_28805/g.70253 Transcript_28805/m.70253 type:complete len:87 (-) Transcript_28805:87-347(-)